MTERGDSAMSDATGRPKVPSDSVDDLASLTHLDEATMLESLRTRYLVDQIYTYVGDILVAVNPFKSLDIYGKEVAGRYSGQGTSIKASPHVYAVAESCYSSMSQSGKSQCCVISGESGAGKTESTKFLINHLINLCPQKSASGLEQKIIQVNPLLEAFGNARTMMNNNSSRFGKYIQVKFKGRQVIGAKISEYLLEKSRVAVQGAGEENFHVFYYMFAGLTFDELESLHLKTARDCRYLKGSWETIERNHSKLKEEHGNLVNAMDLVGFTVQDQNEMFRALATVLALGNVDIEEDAMGYATLVDDKVLGPVAAMLGVEKTILDGYFTSKETLTAGEIITTHLTKEKAQDGRDAMAKALYGRMFSWIILRVNGLLAPKQQIQPSECSEISILDIFGFEHFEHNSFEQICINLANEQIQYFFNQHIFLLEQQEYAKEGVDWNEIVFVDNRPLLELFLAKSTGLFALLDEQSIFPRATDATYASKLEERFKTSPHYVANRNPNVPQFTIVHYAGKVHYHATGFLEKNRDSLPTGAVELFQASSNDLIHDIFMGSITRTGTLAVKSRKRKSGKMRSRRRKGEETFGRSRTATGRRGLTVSAQFKNSLNLLMEKMSLCTPHFVRCIKPNTGKTPGCFEDDFVLSQLRYTGMLETTRIRREGFAIRPSFEEFVSRFKSLAHLKIGANSTGCRRILTATGITGFHIGKTKVFLKYFHLDILAKQLERVHRAATVLQKVLRGHVSRKATRMLFETARRERQLVRTFVATLAESSSLIATRLSSLCQQDAKRPAAATLEKGRGEPLCTIDLPPPPSMDELEANLIASTTISSESSSEGEEDEEVDGFEIDEVVPMPEQWKQKYKRFGKEGTPAASLRWFRETQAPTAVIKAADGNVSKWFHGIICRRTAEQHLINKPHGCFLIRVSETRFGYSLSFRSINRCKHFMIDQTASGKYVIVGESRAHASLQILINFHKKMPICGVPRDILTVPCGQDSSRLDYADLLLERSGSASSSRHSSRNPSPAPAVRPKSKREVSGDYTSQCPHGPLPPPVPAKKSRMRPGSSVEDLLAVDASSSRHLQSSPPAIVQHRSDSWKKRSREMELRKRNSGGGGGGGGGGARERSVSSACVADHRSPQQRVWPPPAGNRHQGARPSSGVPAATEDYHSHAPPRPLSLDHGSITASRHQPPQQQQQYGQGQGRGGKRGSGTAYGSEDSAVCVPLPAGVSAAENRRSRSSSELSGASSQDFHPDPMTTQRSAGQLGHPSVSAQVVPPPVPRSRRPQLDSDDGYSKIGDDMTALSPELVSSPPGGGLHDASKSNSLARPKLILDDSDSDGGFDDVAKHGYNDLDDVMPHGITSSRPQQRVEQQPPPQPPPHQQQKSAAKTRRQKFGSSRRHTQDSVVPASLDGSAPQVPRSARPRHVCNEFVASQSVDSLVLPGAAASRHGPSPPPPVEDIMRRNIHTPVIVPPVPQSERPMLASSSHGGLAPPSDSHTHSRSPRRSPRSSPPPLPKKQIMNVPPLTASSPRSSMLLSPEQPQQPVRPRSKTSGELLSAVSRPPPRIRSKTRLSLDEEPEEYLEPQDELLAAAVSSALAANAARAAGCSADDYLEPQDERLATAVSSALAANAARTSGSHALPPLPGETLNYRAQGGRRVPSPRSSVSASVPVRFGDNSFLDDDMFTDSTDDLFEDDDDIRVPVELLRSQRGTLLAEPTSLSIPENSVLEDVYVAPHDSLDLPLPDADFLEDVYVVPDSDSVYVSPLDSLAPSMSFPLPDAEFLDDTYEAPGDGQAPMYLAVGGGDEGDFPPPPIPDRNYSKRDVDKSLDADIHRYSLLLKEEEMQLKMISWRLADRSMNEDNYANLIRQEERCKSKIISFRHMLASLEVSKNVHPSAERTDAIARGSPPASRRGTESRSSATRSVTSLRKRIDAQKQRKQHS